jgi:exodeoxyribonuclease VII small subunit
MAMAKNETAPDTIPEDIAGMSFEAAMEELEDVVRQLESGEVALDKSIEMYTRGEMLKRHCEQRLKAASEQVERIVTDQDGEAVGVEPAEID